MDLEAYVDESFRGHSHEASPSQIVGALCLDPPRRQTLKHEVNRLRGTLRCPGEIKWNSVSTSRLPFYLALIDILFQLGASLQFRGILSMSKTPRVTRTALARTIPSLDTRVTVFHDLQEERFRDLGLRYYRLLRPWIESSDRRSTS